MNVSSILTQYREALTGGLYVTLELAGIAWSLGLTFGLLLGMAGHRWPSGCGVPVRILAFFFSAVPLLVVLYWVHYPLQTVLQVVVDPFITAATVFSLLNVVGVSEIVRTALDDFPRQYLQAAKACGLSRRRTLWRIQMPIMARQMLPSVLLLQIQVLQMTLFASLISVNELFRVAQRINATIYRPVEVYTALAVFFIAICMPVNAFALWLRRVYTRDISET